MLNEKPLICYSIESLLQSKLVNETYFNTDHENTNEVSLSQSFY